MNTKILIITVILNLILVIKLNAQVAINTDNTTAASSAMLDVKSTTKGLLIPRMTTVQRTAISSPTDGLLVYDATTFSFWFYDSGNSGWMELITESGASELDDLSDGIYKGYSLYLGPDAGINDDGSSNNNSGFGYGSLNKNTSGYYNVAQGYYSLGNNTNGYQNTSVGYASNGYNITGIKNTSLGAFAGQGVFGNSVSGCVFIGNEAGKNNTSDNLLFIDNSSTTTPLIGGDFSSNQVDINGTIKITGGSPASGKILTSDNSGNAQWNEPSSWFSKQLTVVKSYTSSTIIPVAVFASSGTGSSAGAIRVRNSGGNYYNFGITPDSDNAFEISYSDNIGMGSGLFRITSTGIVSLSGTIKIKGGSPGSGKILTSDAYGNATWETYASSLNGLSDATTNTHSVFIGSNSGISDDGSNYNAAIGENALYENISGQYNGSLGYKAAYNNTSGDRNLSIGAYSMYNNATGSHNTALGIDAGKGSSGASFSDCVFVGFQAGMNNVNDNKLFIDNSNTSSPLIGGDFSSNQVDINGTIKITGGTPGAGKVLTSDANGLASWITPSSSASSIDNLNDAVNSGTKLFIGTNAGLNNQGLYNTGIGYESMKLNSYGGDNTAIGFKTLDANTNGSGNTAVGHVALGGNTTGGGNTALGYSALSGNLTGHYNTAIGYNTYTSGSYSNSTAIGYGASISGNNQIHLGNTSITEIKGQVSFTQYSDGRVKNQVEENVPGLEFINRLRPVTYHFDIEKENQIMGIYQTASTKHNEIDSIRFTGFIAQEVEEVAKACDYNFSGVKTPKNEKELYGLSYSEFVVPLVKAVQEQQQIIETQNKVLLALEKRISELEASQKKSSR